MSVAFPPDIELFVEREVSAGEFTSRDELIIAAVDLLRRHKEEHSRLRADIEKGLEGEGVPAKQVFASLKAKSPPHQPPASAGGHKAPKRSPAGFSRLPTLSTPTG